MGKPIQFAALKMVVPAGTRVTLSCGWNSTVTFRSVETFSGRGSLLLLRADL
jgi:hypothetical protein